MPPVSDRNIAIETSKDRLKAGLRTGLLTPVVMLGLLAFSITAGRAQPANDNFASAYLLTGVWGATNVDNTGATAEVGEPNHAGQTPRRSIWFKWTSTEDAQVEFDTFGSVTGTGNPLNTILAVYTAGTDISTLNQVVANRSVNSSAQSLGNDETINWTAGQLNTSYSPPSGVKFNAKIGTTYYVAVDALAVGTVSLNWAYRSSGVFRFSSHSYTCSETESVAPRNSTVSPSPTGARITVTRLFGSTGKVRVNFTTVDGVANLPLFYTNAAESVDYILPGNTTLIFEDNEVTKSFIIPIIDDGGFANNGARIPNCNPNRSFNVQLTTTILDPLEDPIQVSPPRFDIGHTNSQVNILDFDVIPGVDFTGPGITNCLTGEVNFERKNFRCTETVGTVTLLLYRMNGDISQAVETHYLIDSTTTPPAQPSNTELNSFPLRAGSEYASPDVDSPPNDPTTYDGPGSLNADFTLPYAKGAYGTVNWGAFDTSPKPIHIDINNDGLPEFNEDIRLRLFVYAGHANDLLPGNISQTTLTILYNDYPAGALDDAHNPDLSIATDPPNNSRPGADGQVYAIAVQPDDRTIVGGNFGSYNSHQRYGIARMNVNGSIDTSFDPGSGVAVQVGDFISSISLLADGRAAIGGSFSSYNGSPRYGIAQINPDGSLDNTFNPGVGANDTVWAVKALPNGKVLIGGEFTTVNNLPRKHVARLNADGTVDLSFDPGTNGPNGTVNALAVTSDGSIYIGGDFTTVGGLSRLSIARLGTDGLVQTNFNPITGIDGPVFALAVQPADDKVIAAGSFANIQSRHCGNIARFNTDGLLDPTFDAGAGADDAIYTLTLQSDGRIFVGGLFTSINGTRRNAVARLYQDGAVDTHFMDSAYCQFAGLHKIHFNPYVDSKDFLLATGQQSDGKLMIGGSFLYVGGGRFTSAVVTNSPSPAENVGQSRTTYRVRCNVARLLGGDTEGPGSISFVSTNYAAAENQSFLFVKAKRANGSLGQIETTFSLAPRTLGPGVGQSGVDYIYTGVNTLYDTTYASHREWFEGIFGTNNISTDRFGNNWIAGSDDINVTIPHRLGIQGDRSMPFKFDCPSYADVFYLGGENIPLGSALPGGTGSSAMLTVLESDVNRGVISFAGPSYFVNENGTNAVVQLIRTNGSSGQVSVRFATTNGTAVAGAGHDYFGVTNTVTFRDGQTSSNVLVQIIDDNIIQSADKTVNLYLANPGNGATLGLSNSVLYIVDNDFLPGRINMSQTNYVVNETDGSVVVTVTRTGGSLGVVNLQFATSNMSAITPQNYFATNGSLHWDDGDSSPRNITIPINQDGLVTTNLQFKFSLFNLSGTNAFGPRSNAVVTIINQDFYGSLQFGSPSYNVNENGGYATINVIRVGGSAGTVTANYTTSDGTAAAGASYTPTGGTLSFNPGVVNQVITVPILDDFSTDPYPFYFNLALSGFTPAGALPGLPTNTVVNIRDNQSFNLPPGDPDDTFNGGGFNDDVLSVALQPDGRIVAAGAFTAFNGLPVNGVARVDTNGILDSGFLSGLSGANGVVRTLINQSDTRLVIGGDFTIFNGVVRNYLARLNYDGSLDTGFNPGSGASGPVHAVAETFMNGSRKIMVGGNFNTFNGALRSGIVRLNDDGSVDTSFNNGAGANGKVYAVAVYPTNTIFAGKIVIGGEFTAVNGVSRTNIARLNLDGSLDATFNPGAGADGPVRALVIQPDGRVLAGGSFTNVNHVALNRIARLNTSGSVDGTFQVAPGANDTVYTLALQPDNRILVGGEFTRASGVTRGRLTRLMPNGTVDPTINFGAGANNFVASVAVQPDDRIVIGGGFTTYHGVPAAHLARLYGGSVTGSGKLVFEFGNYYANENSTNVQVNVIRTGGTSGPNPDGSGHIFVDFATSDDTAIAGVNYSNVAVTLDFPMGETIQTVTIPVIDDNTITPDLTANMGLSNPTSPAELGPQPTAVLTIINTDSQLSFSSATYSRDENAIDGLATIHVLRSGTIQTTVSVTFETTFGGTAVPGVNYTPVTNVLTFGAGQTDLIVQIPIFHDPQANGNVTVNMDLTNPQGAALAPPSSAVLTIVDVDQGPGQITFSSPIYSVNEQSPTIVIPVLRTNGRNGIVSAGYYTVPGTAAAGVRYYSTNGTVTFGDGETLKFITVGIINDNQVLGNQTFNVNLTNLTGNATFGSNSIATVTVLEDDTGLSFATPVYVAPETDAQITLTVLRPYGTNVTSQVSYATTNGSAVAPSNYVAASGVLTFNPGETFKTLTLNLRHDTNVTGNISFGVNLSSPVNGQLTFPSTATIVLLDAEAGLSFASSNLVVLENATNIALTVICSNPNVEPVSVNFATADGTNDTPAFAGVDYVAVSGTLTFTNGITTNTIVVPIIDNLKVDANRTFYVNLFNPSVPGVLIPPYSATITISNNDAGLSFSSSAYDVFKNGVAASIGVVRTGYTNSFVSVYFTTYNGTATNGVDYITNSGVLNFSPGQTTTNFSVSVIDSTVVKPNRTVGLILSNVVGNASLVLPSQATLTIHDNSGSLIVPAGSLLISESLGQNGVIEPGENVTLLFALRNAGGTNTANLVATLLPTNGITSPSGAQSYGSLAVDGPSASRSFSFTASGTNGQTINATFALQDGAINRGTAVFSYVLGSAPSSFSNTNVIVINDNTNATPYPATNLVSGVGGYLSKITVTLSNMSHFFPADVDMLLLSPAGQKMLLMANSGSAPMQNVTLTFDDNAANALPQSGAITNGTYRPNGVGLVTTFPAPAPPPPYATNLSAFNNSNPNGTWSLFVMDDSPGGSGGISNGWSLNLTTLNPVGSAADLVAGITASNYTTVTTNLLYRINLQYSISLTNFGPGTAANISLTDIIPTNATLVSASSGYTYTSNAYTVGFNVASLAKDAATNFTLTISVPPVAATVSNVVTALAAGPSDPNLANNTAYVNTTVVAPTADLVLNLSGTPNPILLGDTIKYTLVVSNNINLSPAGGVKLTNTLSPYVVLLSNTPAPNTINGNVLTFNLGTLASGATSNVLLWVRPLYAVSITNSASVGSILTDQFKANNFATIKTVVEPFTASRSGQNIVISWPSDVGAYVVETTTNLHFPNWTQLTNPPAQFSGGQYTITLGTTNTSRFFRLRKTGP